MHKDFGSFAYAVSLFHAGGDLSSVSRVEISFTHKIINGLYRFFRADQFMGLLCEAVGNCCDRIGSFYPKTDGIDKGHVVPKHSNIRSVQSRHDADIPPWHLPGKNPADCMGDSIMHMDQIQSVSCDDFGNLTRQCDVIWRIFEYAVISDVGLMDMDIGVAGVQPERNIRC